MKAFVNILIIGLIGLCSSVYLFNLSPVDYRGTIEIETPAKNSALSIQTEKKEMLNPESITITHTSAKDEVIKIVTDSIFAVDIYKDNKLIKSNVGNLELFSPSINATISVSENNPLSTTLNISQKKLNLEDGIYEFTFNSNLISNENNSSLSVKVKYDTSGIYYSSVNIAPIGTKGLTLYFAAENDAVLIPVTRFVVEDKSITRMAIEQLQKGTVNTGLKTVIKDVTNTTYNNGNVLIDIPSTFEEYNSANTSDLSYNSFVKTIFAVDRYWPIYSVSFTVDRKNVETYFNGMNLKALPNAEDNYVLYMAYKAGERYYLFENKLKPEQINILNNETIDSKAKKLFDAYFAIDMPDVINPIPKALILNNATLTGKILALDFNEDFLNVYKDRNDLRNMMIESFMYTFTTIPGVDSIKITVQGKEINNFIKGIDMTKPLKPPEFINPETIEKQE